MNDVNLNSPDLKLVRSSEQAPARASLPPRTGGEAAPVQSVASNAYASAAAESAKKAAELGSAVSQLNDYVQNVQRDLQFEVNEELGQTIVKVVDNQTQKVIRQIPDDVALKLAENLQQEEPLTLFNIKV